MKRLIAPLLLLTSLSAYAESQLGLGGDVIVCRNADGSIKKTELLVHYEGRVNRGLLNVEHPHLTHEEYFNELSQRVVPVEHLLQTEMALTLVSALSNYRETGAIAPGFRFTSDRLTDSPDYVNVIPPKGCVIEQALLKLKPKFAADPTFMVQADIIKHLSEESLRGLILDAALDRLYEKDVTWTRYFQQKITSTALEDLNFRSTILLFNSIVKSSYMIKQTHVPRDYASQSVITDATTGQLKLISHRNEFQTVFSHILNDDGTVDREKTLKEGKSYFHFKMTSFGKNDRHCPEDQFSGGHCEVNYPNPVVEISYEDGSRISSSMNYYGNTLLHGGLITMKVTIPKQGLDLSKKAFRYARYKVNDLVILDKVPADGKPYTGTFRIDLDEKNNWILLPN